MQESCCHPGQSEAGGKQRRPCGGSDRRRFLDGSRDSDVSAPRDGHLLL